MVETVERERNHMADAARYVHIVDEVPSAGGRPVLLHSLEGFLDAGNAAQLAVQHLVGQNPGKVVASFDVDEFYDYRARRPPMTFAQDHYEEYEAPRLVVRLVEDADGAPYLLLSGPEPDSHWEAFAKAVRRVVEHFDVRLVVGLGAVPMAVPHTRPTKLTQHASSAHLLTQANVWTGEIRIPSSAQAVMEMRLGEWDHEAMGYVAHIPHYVAQFDYPYGAVALLEAVGEATGLTWDLEDLRTAGAHKAGEIAAQIEDSAEVRDVVQGLEQQYDAFHRSEDDSQNLLADDQPIPTGDELGAQFEHFLAGLDRPDRPEEQ